MRKMTFGKELKRQLAEKNRKHSETAGDPASRKATLQSNIDWANNVDKRANDDLKHRRGEYHGKKALWNLTAGTDEEPREYFHHSRKAQIYRISAIALIFIEVTISSLVFYGLMVFGWPVAISVITAILIATVVTVAIAVGLHGGVSYLVDLSDDPFVKLRRLRWVVLPSLILVLLSIISYVAIQRLDPITLLAWKPVLATSKYVAMLGLLGLGVALLIGADIYDWSAEPALEYQELESIRQEIANYRREWTDELNGGTQPTPNANLTSHVPIELSEVKVDQEVALNGNRTNPSTPMNSTVNSVIALLFVSIALFSAACSAPEAEVKLSPVVENIEMDAVFDASGVKNYSALQQAGQNLFNNSMEIIEQNNIKTFNVFWFGENGWTPEPKVTVDMPIRMRASAILPDLGDIGQYRPDVVEAENKLYEEQIKNANANLDEKYKLEIKNKISEMEIDALIPPSEKETMCTDINGLIGRYAQPDSKKLHLIFVITDARQNCDNEYSFHKILIPKNKLFVFIIVPGTDADGLDAFEFRKSNILVGCPSCIVVPYYRKDLSVVTKEVCEKRLLAQK
jgi:hypothetical protein